MSLGLIKKAETKASLNMFAAAKIFLLLNERTTTSAASAAGPQETQKAPRLAVPAPGYMCLVFHHKGRDTLLEKLSSALKMQEWKVTDLLVLPVISFTTSLQPLEKPKQKKQEFTTTGAGICMLLASRLSSAFVSRMILLAAGIMRSVKRDQQHTDKSLATAFADLDSLMQQAKEMVRLQHRHDFSWCVLSGNLAG